MIPAWGNGSSPDVRVSDEERTQIVELLRRHCAEGRLTLDEFADRVGTVYDARTRGEIEIVLSDLPVLDRSAAVSSNDFAPPETRSTRPAVTWTVGIMSAGTQKGQWRPAETTSALAIMGGVELDFRRAIIETPEITVNATAIMGGIDIVVPEGVEVIVSGFPLMGGIDCKVADVPRLPGTPIIRVKAFAFWGGVTVRNKRQRPKPSDRPSHRDHRDVHERHRQRIEQKLEQNRQRIEERAERWAHKVEQTAEHWSKVLNVNTEQAEQVEERAAAHAAPDGTVTILITDMCGSTEMAERLGDHRWLQVLRRHNEIIRRCVVNHGGSEIKNQGDGFMIAFPSARRALLCAISIQRAFADHRKENPDEPVEVRIGLHTGEVVREAGDLFGRNVIMTARITDQADANEIVCSSLVKQLTDSGGDLGFDGEREVELKGLSGPHRVYTLNW
ncbi:MAG: DUF1707 domain-containing protein [Actinomycetota bacterium]